VSANIMLYLFEILRSFLCKYNLIGFIRTLVLYAHPLYL